MLATGGGQGGWWALKGFASKVMSVVKATKAPDALVCTAVSLAEYILLHDVCIHLGHTLHHNISP